MEVIENNAIVDDLTHSLDGRVTCAGVFTPADALSVFNAHFMDYEFSRIWILKRLHPDGAHCPGCGADVPENKLQRFWSNGRMACRQCGKYFTALTGTFISGSQLDFRNIILLAVLLALRIPARQIAEMTNMSAENVRLWEIKFAALERMKKEGLNGK